MFIERIVSEGIAHNSYLIGGRSEAWVIDPRRDCEIYLETTNKKEIHITHVFETLVYNLVRNFDF